MDPHHSIEAAAKLSSLGSTWKLQRSTRAEQQPHVACPLQACRHWHSLARVWSWRARACAMPAREMTELIHDCMCAGLTSDPGLPGPLLPDSVLGLCHWPEAFSQICNILAIFAVSNGCRPGFCFRSRVVCACCTWSASTGLPLGTARQPRCRIREHQSHCQVLRCCHQFTTVRLPGSGRVGG